MLELSGWGDILRGIVMLYWLAGASLFYFSVKKSSTRVGKVVSGTIVFFIFGFFPLKWQVERVLAVRDHKARLERARAIFQERCKNAGEKIYRTVEGVEAIAILRKRRDVGARPQNMEDPFGAAGNPWESDYPLSFLLPRQKNGQFMGGWMTYEKFHDEWDRPGYAYVDLRNQDDNSIVRYTLAIAFPKQDSTRESGEKFDDSGEPRPYRFVVNPFPSPGPMPRYGVIFEDLTTPEERALWVAGSAFRVLDLETNEVLGERIGYFMDEGMGSTATARTPWIEAQQWSCPSYSVDGWYRSDWDRQFAEQVLKIKNP